MGLESPTPWTQCRASPNSCPNTALAPEIAREMVNSYNSCYNSLPPVRQRIPSFPVCSVCAPCRCGDGEARYTDGSPSGLHRAEKDGTSSFSDCGFIAEQSTAPRSTMEQSRSVSPSPRLFRNDLRQTAVPRSSAVGSFSAHTA